MLVINHRNFPNIVGVILGECKHMTQWILILIVISFVSGECPSNVQRQAFSCFTDFNTQLINMQKSRGTLFSGVDVEVLRAFCSSYNHAINCVNSFKSQCPESEHRRIDITLRNLEGARNELAELCGDDKIYELYARHMSCFQNWGSYSERCFEDIMNTTIRLMKRIDDKRLDELCWDLSLTLNCIRDNIDRNCGPEAANLVHILVKPMVRRSTMCQESAVQDSKDSGLGVATTTSNYYVQSSDTHHVVQNNRPEKLPTSTATYHIESHGTRYVIRVRSDDIDDRSGSGFTRGSLKVIVSLLFMMVFV